MERYNTLPVVRCPWGCSETYRHCNTVPYDTYCKFIMNEDIHLMKKYLGCANGFRSDVMTKPCNILENPDPEWECSPSVEFTRLNSTDTFPSPVVLCCRYHSSSNPYRYVHTPTNPTGSISFESDNTLSQLIAIPRCIKSFEKKLNNCTYQINAVMGSYAGIDSIYLTDKMRDGGGKKCIISTQRDQVAFQACDDYRIFILSLPSHKRSNVFHSQVAQFLGGAYLSKHSVDEEEPPYERWE